MFFQKFLVLLFRLVNGPHDRRPFFEVDLLSGSHPKILKLDFHLLPSVVTNCVSALGTLELGRWTSIRMVLTLRPLASSGLAHTVSSLRRGRSCAVLLKISLSIMHW